MLEVFRLRPSPPDTGRFGLQVWRATSIDAGSVLDELAGSGADVAIYRLPTSTSGPIKELARLGFEVIDAGTLVYYRMDLARHVPAELRNRDITITPVGDDDDDTLAELVDASFDGYASHYLANPLFSPDSALAGYREWALRHRLDKARCASWIARRNGQAVAFACCLFDADGRICDGGIYGVLPSEARTGLFGDLIRFTQAYFRERGFLEMRMSTKVDNFAVQKVWVREGYHLYATFDTLHVNALLSAGSETTAQRDLQWPGTGCGLEIAPAFSELLAQLHGKGRPSSMSQVVLVPPSPGDACTLSVRIPRVHREDRFARATATLHDQAGMLRVLGYATLDLGAPATPRHR